MLNIFLGEGRSRLCFGCNRAVLSFTGEERGLAFKGPLSLS